MRYWLPILYICIEVPFISIRTELWSENMDTMTREYVALEIKFWKWHGRFRLYSPMAKFKK
jgi:hypothetical protein